MIRNERCTERRICVKKYSNPMAELILFGKRDILTASIGDDIGMNVPSVKDEDWQIGQ